MEAWGEWGVRSVEVRGRKVRPAAGELPQEKKDRYEAVKKTGVSRPSQVSVVRVIARVLDLQIATLVSSSLFGSGETCSWVGCDNVY